MMHGGRPLDFLLLDMPWVSWLSTKPIVFVTGTYENEDDDDIKRR